MRKHVGEAGETSELEAQVARAQRGDRAALESVVCAIQKDVYALALRFLWHPEDAEDATQGILIRIVTNLGGFRGESAFRTWVYRVACNLLLSLRKQRMERQAMSYEQFLDDLAQGLSDEPSVARAGVEEELLLEEVKIGCTLAMLLCLDREQRLAYVLGEIMELEHGEAAAVLEVSPAAYRKRLSRARDTITRLMRARCGLVNPANACRCRKRVDSAIALKRIDPQQLLFASSPEQARRFPQVLEKIRGLEEMRRAAALYRAHPQPEPRGGFVAWLRELIAAERP